VLHLRDDDKKYLEEWEIRDVVRNTRYYIEHPVVMDVTREREDPLSKEKRIKTTEGRDPERRAGESGSGPVRDQTGRVQRLLQACVPRLYRPCKGDHYEQRHVGVHGPARISAASPLRYPVPGLQDRADAPM